MNAHEQTPEQLAIAAEGNDHARDRQFIKLGIAVIMQAIEDASRTVPETTETTTEDQRHVWNTLRAYREEARVCLTTYNDILRFWCYVAGIDPMTIINYAKNAEGRWEEVGQVLRANNWNLRKAS